ncbi:MAG: Gfo/Idh/MocA family oxidoreductase, partial [Parafannyhessea umbonata]
MRVAVVGTGFISTLVAPKIARWGYTVTDVVSTPRSLAKAQELAGPLGARAGCDYDAVLAREDVDAVYLGIPNDLHHDYAMRALKAGKHVIL